MLTSDGRFAYTTNTGSGNVSGYSVRFDGTLQLLQGGISANTGPSSSPVDAAISNDSRFLYVLAPGTRNVQEFAIGLDGSLTPVSAGTALGIVPASATDWWQDNLANQRSANFCQSKLFVNANHRPYRRLGLW